MAKIMLVEDDNNLREIYEARLLAEGYEIVAAKDGEEALALAVKERPDLIISDVMMPKISGFDMLDILRSTPETKDTKVIMMTALSQAEDKTRADKLGADRYLVKSQVTLEDVAKVAHDVLTGENSAATPPMDLTPAAEQPTVTPADVVTEPAAPTEPIATEPAAAPITDTPAQDTSTPAEPTPIAVTVDEPTTPVVAAINDNLSQPIASEEAEVASQINAALASDDTATADVPTETPAVTPTPNETATETAIPVSVETEAPAASAEEPAVVEPSATPEPESVATPAAEPVPAAPQGDKRVIQPINDVKGPDINELLKQEEAKEAAPAAAPGQPLDPAKAHQEEPAAPPAAPGTNISPNDISL